MVMVTGSGPAELIDAWDLAGSHLLLANSEYVVNQNS
jgi:hypothetical protein